MEDGYIDIVKIETPWLVRFQIDGQEQGVLESVRRNTIDKFVDNFLKVLVEPRGAGAEDTKMVNSACAIAAAGSAFVPARLSPVNHRHRLPTRMWNTQLKMCNAEYKFCAQGHIGSHLKAVHHPVQSQSASGEVGKRHCTQGAGTERIDIGTSAAACAGVLLSLQPSLPLPLGQMECLAFTYRGWKAFCCLVWIKRMQVTLLYSATHSTGTPTGSNKDIRRVRGQAIAWEPQGDALGPWPSAPAHQHQKTFLEEKVKFIKGAANMRQIIGTLIPFCGL